MPIVVAPRVFRPAHAAAGGPAGKSRGRLMILLFVLFILFITPVAAAAADGGAAVPRKTVLLIAGADDDHPPGTHEYAATCRELAELLEGSNVGPRVRVVVADNGWPADEELIGEADGIFLASAGADHDEADHPFLKGDRWAKIEAATARGCGLVMLHWSTFLPDRLDGSVMRTLGGRFDYEGGPQEKGWESRIDFAEVPVSPATPDHPALAGVERFILDDEFYHRLAFPADRAGWTPLLTAPLPGDGGETSMQTVAWALERATNPGGPPHRAVGFTGGHFQTNFGDEDYHRFLLNAVAWSAGVPVPAGGVRTFDELWTPASVRVGTAEPYELEKEKDWHDDRVTRTDQGPFAFSSIELPGGEVVRKGVAVRTAGRPEPFILIDTETAAVRANWGGRMLEHSDRRFGLIDLPKVGGEATGRSPADARWTVEGRPAEVRYDRLTVDGTVATPWWTVDGVPVRLTSGNGLRYESGPEGSRLTPPPGGPKLEVSEEPLDEPRSNPTPRWGGPLVTGGTLGEPLPQTGGAFAVDSVDLPFENPHRALLYLAGLDFTPDGTAYVAAAHGDVWQVKGLGGDLGRVEWRRFATGLYQPLGLKVRGGEVFVLGRDRITKLVDANGDGEADRYESFNADLDILGEPHAYAMGLETDGDGNFYFLKSGPAETEHGGTLARVAADGSELTVLGTGFRHPNGVGVAPPGSGLSGFVTAADNEGNWVPATPLHAVPAGPGAPRAAEADYYAGYVPTARRENADDFDSPVLWMPRAAETSAGGQVWVPTGDRGAAWGPLAGALLHLSFGRCTANLVLTESIPQTSDEPFLPAFQGAVVPLPGVRFYAGSCRGRFYPGTGDLWVAGLDGWQTAAVRDGCLQRLRRTDEPLRLPTAVRVHRNGIELRFATELGDAAADPAAWSVGAWTYRRGADYGSPELKPSDPATPGHDAWAVKRVSLSPDRTRAFLVLPDIAPVMQYSVVASLNAADGAPVPVELFGTIHRPGDAWDGWGE